MTRAIQKADGFIADYENLFAWYVDRAGSEVAWRLQTALDRSLIKLAALPDLGRPRHFRHPALAGLRSLPLENPFGNLLIFYRANDENLFAVRLMHGAR